VWALKVHPRAQDRRALTKAEGARLYAERGAAARRPQRGVRAKDEQAMSRRDLRDHQASTKGEGEEGEGEQGEQAPITSKIREHRGARPPRGGIVDHLIFAHLIFAQRLMCVL
jgi:hypothetical protein